MATPSIGAGTVADKPTDSVKHQTANILKKLDKLLAKAAPKVRDDLALIEGIGPKIAKILNDAGVSTFQALATTPAAAVQTLLDQAGPRFAIAGPGTWAEQARLLARGDRAAFQKLTERLTGGVRK